MIYDNDVDCFLMSQLLNDCSTSTLHETNEVNKVVSSPLDKTDEHETNLILKFKTILLILFES